MQRKKDNGKIFPHSLYIQFLVEWIQGIPPLPLTDRTNLEQSLNKYQNQKLWLIYIFGCHCKMSKIGLTYLANQHGQNISPWPFRGQHKIGLLLCHSHIDLRLRLRLSWVWYWGWGWNEVELKFIFYVFVNSDIYFYLIFGSFSTFWGPNRLFFVLGKGPKTVLGSTHVVKQLSFSMLP